MVRVSTHHWKNFEHFLSLGSPRGPEKIFKHSWKILKIFPRENPNHKDFLKFFFRRFESLALENFEKFSRENPNYNKILKFFLGARGNPNSKIWLPKDSRFSNDSTQRVHLISVPFSFSIAYLFSGHGSSELSSSWVIGDTFTAAWPVDSLISICQVTPTRLTYQLWQNAHWKPASFEISGSSCFMVQKLVDYRFDL